MFQLHSTEDVLAETLYRLRRKHPKWDGGQISRLRSRIIDVLDELVEDYNVEIPYDGSDPNDRHVHSAAVASHADILLTADGGFATLASANALPYSVYSCDDLFVLIDDSGSRAVQRVVDRQRDYWNRKREEGKPVKALVEALTGAGCPKFAARVQEHLRTLSGPTATTHPKALPN